MSAHTAVRRVKETPAAHRLASCLQIQENGCWYWTGFVTPQGYGAVGYRGQRNVPAHRAVYEEFVGPIADEMTLDHLCHTNDSGCPGGNACVHRRCVNPDHLEEVTADANNRRQRFRKANCVNGHEYTPENSHFTKQGKRVCVTCLVSKGRLSPKRLPS